MMKDLEIEVIKWNLYYGKKHTLKDISLEIKKNSVMALIGPSGCGKSTFLRCLNRMNDLIENVHTEGKILLEGEDIYGEKVDPVMLRRRVGMVFQSPNPFPVSIYDNIAYGPRLQGIRDKGQLENRVEEALRNAAVYEEVRDILRKPALGLSGGQQQRICIARALAARPEVLLMDEPTSALDPISTLKIEELLRELKKRYTVVIVTHNLQQAARISDDTAFFLGGELVEWGATDAVLCRPRERKTENYITGRFG